MKNKRTIPLLATLATSPVIAAPFLAIGQNAELFLTASTIVRFEDNIDYRPTNEISDQIFEFTPGAELIFGKNSLTSGSLVVYERLIAYSDTTQLNDQLFEAVFRASYDGPKLKVRTTGSIRELNQTSQDASINQFTFDTYAANDEYSPGIEYGAGVNAELPLTQKTKIGAGISYGKTDYEAAGQADRTSYTIPVNYYFAIRPKLDVSAGVRYRKTDVDLAFADSEDYYFNVGARGEFTPKLTGNLSAGYTFRDSDTGDTGLFGFDAGLSYQYSPKTQFRLSASNDFNTGVRGGGQEKARITLGVGSQLTTALNVNASLGYQNIKFIGAGRTDDFITLGLGAVYTFNRHVNVAASYSHYNKESNSALDEFTANIVSLSANFRY